MSDYVKKFAAVAFWLLVWQLTALLVNNQILLCGPLDVVWALAGNIITLPFWSSVGYSLSRIIGGFLIALLLGLALGTLSWRVPAFLVLLNPAVQLIKSVPIVCFIVLLLMWFGAQNVSILAVFLAVFPAFYFSTLEGLKASNANMSQLLTVFRVPLVKSILAEYWPSLLPFLFASSKVAVGMAWKAGIAAELIGLPLASIGANIYQAKILLSSEDLFAWTLVVVALSIVCERGFLWIMERSGGWSWRRALPRLKVAGTLPLEAPAPLADDTLSNTSAGQAPSAAEIHLADVVKSFDGVACVKGITRSFSPQSRVALLGASGSGKTTFLFLLAGIAKPDLGTVDLRGQVSMVFQDTRLFGERTAIENIQLVAGKQRSPENIRQMLCQLLPGEALDKPVSQLSGGMKRRVELVRALAVESDFVLLDEPFSGLDETNREKAQAFVVQHLAQRGLIISSHDSRDASALGITEKLVTSDESNSETSQTPSQETPLETSQGRKRQD